MLTRLRGPERKAIIRIDQSPLWRGPRRAREDVSRLLDTLFHSRLGRWPASRLDVFLLSRALECSVAAIERHAGRRPYSSTRPERTAQRISSATVCTPTLFMIRPR